MKDKQQKWFSISIEAKNEAEEAIEFALNKLDCSVEVNRLGKNQSEWIGVIVKL